MRIRGVNIIQNKIKIICDLQRWRWRPWYAYLQFYLILRSFFRSVSESVFSFYLFFLLNAVLNTHTHTQYQTAKYKLYFYAFLISFIGIPYLLYSLHISLFIIYQFIPGCCFIKLKTKCGRKMMTNIWF